MNEFNIPPWSNALESPSTPSENQYGYPSVPHTHPNQDKCSGISIPIWKDLREMLIATFKEWMAILIPTLKQCMEYSSTLLWNQQWGGDATAVFLREWDENATLYINIYIYTWIATSLREGSGDATSTFSRKWNGNATSTFLGGWGGNATAIFLREWDEDAPLYIYIYIYIYALPHF